MQCIVQYLTHIRYILEYINKNRKYYQKIKFIVYPNTSSSTTTCHTCYITGHMRLVEDWHAKANSTILMEIIIISDQFCTPTTNYVSALNHRSSKFMYGTSIYTRMQVLIGCRIRAKHSRLFPIRLNQNQATVMVRQTLW